MEKIKGICSKVGTAVKSHLKIVIAVVAVIVVLIILANVLGGSEKKVIKKYFSAMNSYKAEKVMKVIDVKGRIAYLGLSSEVKEDEDLGKEFKDAYDDVDDDDVESAEKTLEDSLDDTLDEMKDAKAKMKLSKVVNVATAKSEKKLKRVTVKYSYSMDATEEEKDEAEDNDAWKGLKATKTTGTGYQTFYIYKGKIVYMSSAL